MKESPKGCGHMFQGGSHVAGGHMFRFNRMYEVCTGNQSEKGVDAKCLGAVLNTPDDHQFLPTAVGSRDTSI